MNLPNVQAATWVDSEQNSVLHRITNRIRRSLELQEILTATVAEVRSLLGTDRVKIYKFHSDQSGQVVAESIYDNRLPSLLGLNFPAGDIPPHARELFIKSRVRSIVDVNLQQIGHSPFQELEYGDTLSEDVHYRPVDPCHLEYLTAMGVKSSVVVPIFHYEQLWGLLVSHQSESRAIPNTELQLLQLVVNQLSIAIAQSEHLAQVSEQAQREAALNRLNNFLHSLSTVELQPALEEAVVAFQGVGGRLCIKAACTSNPDRDLEPSSAHVLHQFTDRAYNLQEGTDRSFADCLKSGNVHVYTYGVQPKPPELAKHRLMEQYNVWQEHYKSGEYDIWAVSDLYQIDALRNLQAAFYTTKIRSILMIPLQYRQQLFGYLSIFRNEFETETLWAGRVEEDQRQIYPQLSFEAWRDGRRATMHKWSASELELARSIGGQFSTAIYQYEMRQQLQNLNTKLESQVQERTAKLLKASDDIQQAAEQHPHFSQNLER